jgi:hypothetical protein
LRPSAAALVTLATLASAVVVACSLTTDFAALSDGTDDGGQGAGDGPAIALDGSADSAGPDSDLDADVKPFACSDHVGATFCSDLDGTPVSLGWTEPRVQSDGTVTSVAGRFGLGMLASSPPRTDPTDSVIAELTTTLPIAAHAPFTFAFDTKIDSSTGAGTVDLANIEFHGPYYVVSLRLNPSGTMVLRYYGDATGSASNLDERLPLLAQPALGRWVHVVMHMTFASSEPRLTVSFDGTSAFDGTIQAEPYASVPAVSVGIGGTDDLGNAFQVAFDDVLVTAE